MLAALTWLRDLLKSAVFSSVPIHYRRGLNRCHDRANLLLVIRLVGAHLLHILRLSACIVSAPFCSCKHLCCVKLQWFSLRCHRGSRVILVVTLALVALIAPAVKVII